MSGCLSVLQGRACGVLAHVTSLPGQEGLGVLGRDAFRFVDRLWEAGQRVWQILPLNPVQADGSPYAALSSFAGAEHVVALELLAEQGWLQRQELAALAAFDPGRIPFAEVLPLRRALLRRAAGRFLEAGGSAALEVFLAAERGPWLADYALFRALLEAHEGADWTRWPTPLRDRRPEALAQARLAHAARIAEIEVEQFWFDAQWRALRAHAARRGVLLFGDVPIYVAQNSADVWCAPQLFQLHADGSAKAVAGCPPDQFTALGQRWGNPVYDWQANAAESFAWWTARMARAFAWYDLVRIDHFRAFASYWEIPADSPDATTGRWVPAPGQALFSHLQRTFPALPVVAEDLGFITPDVYELRDAFDFPGMHIIQYELEQEPLSAEHEPSAYRPCSVAYFGNHDNETAIGWLERQRAEVDPATVQRRPRLAAALASPEAHWLLNRTALEAGSDLAVLQMQDLLGLGAEHRTNVPGTTEGNWLWRFGWEDLPAGLWARLRSETARARRLPAQPERPAQDSPLSALLDEVDEQFLARQDPFSGLLPAGPARNRHGDYSHAWVRDNAFCVLAIWAAREACRRAGLEGLAQRYGEAAEGVLRGLLLAMRRQSGKVERFIQTGHPLDGLHAKFDAETGAPVHGDAEWGHLQLDATAMFLLLCADLTAAGLSILRTPEEFAFAERLMAYLGRSWRTPDFGMWERGDKRNIGKPERNASSIGLARAALISAPQATFTIEGRVLRLAPRPQEELALFEAALEGLLPEESLSKETDGALLAAVGFPAFAAPTPALREAALAKARRLLAGPYGFARFLRDGHQAPGEDAARLHYEPGELARFAGQESQWPLFLGFEALDAAMLGAPAAAEAALGWLEAVCVEQGGRLLTPEMYPAHPPGEDARALPRRPNDNVPLYWSQSLFLAARLLREGLVQPQDLDPLGRRHGLAPAAAGAAAPLALLAARGLVLRAQPGGAWLGAEALEALERQAALPQAALEALAAQAREAGCAWVGLDLSAVWDGAGLLAPPLPLEQVSAGAVPRDWSAWRRSLGAYAPVGGAFAAAVWGSLSRVGQRVVFPGGASLDSALCRADHTEGERAFAVALLEALCGCPDLVRRALAIEALAAFSSASVSLPVLDLEAWLQRAGGAAVLAQLPAGEVRERLLAREAAPA
jgi:4-alpha-glucanotransferase